MKKNFQPSLVDNRINENNLPNHIAIIMDGNGRWAKQRGAMRVFGHKNAIKAVRETSEICAEIGINYLTLYAFSTENWNRPEHEVKALMQLLVQTIQSELPTLLKNNIRLQTLGDTDGLPNNCKSSLLKAIEETAHCNRMILNLALNYGSRNDIIRAVQSIANEILTDNVQPKDINESLFKKYLTTHQLPDPELLIRTSGEMRISNFLLWEIAYTELYITPILWPDFRKKDLLDAIFEYQKRERRFGKTGEEVTE